MFVSVPFLRKVCSFYYILFILLWYIYVLICKFSIIHNNFEYPSRISSLVLLLVLKSRFPTNELRVASNA